MALLVGNNNVASFTLTGPSLNGLDGTRANGMIYTASASGTITSLRAYLYDSGQNEVIKIGIALMTDADSATLIDVTDPIVLSAATEATWVEGAASGSVVSGSDYFIFCYIDGVGARVPAMNSGNGNYVDDDSGTYASPANFNAIGADGGNVNMALYADGTVGGGATGRGRLVGGKLVGGNLLGRRL